MWQIKFHTHTEQASTPVYLFFSTNINCITPVLCLLQAVPPPPSKRPTLITYPCLMRLHFITGRKHNANYLFLESLQYLNSKSLIFTVMTSHIPCGQPHFPCPDGFLPAAVRVWRNSINISLIPVRYYKKCIQGPAVVGIPWYNTNYLAVSEILLCYVGINGDFTSSGKISYVDW